VISFFVRQPIFLEPLLALMVSERKLTGAQRIERLREN